MEGDYVKMVNKRDSLKDCICVVKGGIPRNNCLAQLEKKRLKEEEKTLVSSSKALTRFSSLSLKYVA